MKIVEVILDKPYQAIAREIAEKYETPILWEGSMEGEGRHAFRLLVEPGKRQAFLDELQGHLESSPTARILVIPVEAALPQAQPAEKEKKGLSEEDGGPTREELYTGIEKNARLTGTYLVLVMLSTVVAAIGLVEDNVAVVIGAMVIAPLLGPNLALALAASLGDSRLMWNALKTTAAGLILALALSVIVGATWPLNIESRELLARTDVGLDSVALALASGLAAVLSLTTGVPSVLVGVMVAVALLPPTATIGLMLGSGQYRLAFGATLLLAVNIVCVNLAAKLGFFARGITPRTVLQKEKAKRSVGWYIVFWVVSLGILIGAISYLHSGNI